MELHERLQHEGFRAVHASFGIHCRTSSSGTRRRSAANGHARVASRVTSLRPFTDVAQRQTTRRQAGDAIERDRTSVFRRLHPKRPCAISTRHACPMGQNTGYLSSQPTRRRTVRARAQGPLPDQRGLRPHPGHATLSALPRFPRPGGTYLIGPRLLPLEGSFHQRCPRQIVGPRRSSLAIAAFGHPRPCLALLSLALDSVRTAATRSSTDATSASPPGPPSGAQRPLRLRVEGPLVHCPSIVYARDRVAFFGTPDVRSPLLDHLDVGRQRPDTRGRAPHVSALPERTWPRPDAWEAGPRPPGCQIIGGRMTWLRREPGVVPTRGCVPFEVVGQLVG
jgi:hypothetical protein